MTAHLVPIQQFDLTSARPQPVVDNFAQGGLTGGAQTGEPDREPSFGAVVLDSGLVGTVGNASDHSSRDRQVRHRVNHDERTRLAVLIVLVTKNGFVGL